MSPSVSSYTESFSCRTSDTNSSSATDSLSEPGTGSVTEAETGTGSVSLSASQSTSMNCSSSSISQEQQATGCCTPSWTLDIETAGGRTQFQYLPKPGKKYSHYLDSTWLHRLRSRNFKGIKMEVPRPSSTPCTGRGVRRLMEQDKVLRQAIEKTAKQQLEELSTKCEKKKKTVRHTPYTPRPPEALATATATATATTATATTSRASTATPGPAPVPRPPNKVPLKDIVERLYGEPLRTGRARYRALHEKYVPSSEAKKPSSTDLPTFINRMFTQPLKDKQSLDTKLSRKYPQGGAKSAPCDIEESLYRLYDLPLEHAASANKKLRKKYLKAKKQKKLSNEGQTRANNRLYSVLAGTRRKLEAVTKRLEEEWRADRMHKKKLTEKQMKQLVTILQCHRSEGYSREVDEPTG